MSYHCYAHGGPAGSVGVNCICGRALTGAQPAPAAPSVTLPSRAIDQLIVDAGIRSLCDPLTEEQMECFAHTVTREVLARLPSAAPAAQPVDSAMEVDALRYRYWRAGNAITVVVPLPPDGKKKDRNITVIYSANAEPAWGDSLDDAIDRARALVAKETPHG